MQRQCELDERERAVLDFEREWARHQGTKQAAIRERFGFSPARYYQLLARVVDEPAAMAYDPLTVRRVQRRRRERGLRQAGRATSVVPPR